MAPFPDGPGDHPEPILPERACHDLLTPLTVYVPGGCLGPDAGKQVPSNLVPIHQIEDQERRGKGDELVEGGRQKGRRRDGVALLLKEFLQQREQLHGIIDCENVPTHWRRWLDHVHGTGRLLRLYR